MPSLSRVLGVILAGGAGKRLFPLTKERSKPAVPFAGKYRLIDLPISNCINSNINRIAVLTQYNSVSLHRHITRTYNFDTFHQGWVQIWAAEQTPMSLDWYQGSADAVRKQMLEIRSTHAKDIIILGGDHLYHMDYSDLAQFHWDNNADVTVAVQPVRAEQASSLGILHVQKDGRIIDFVEKPQEPDLLRSLVSTEDPARPYLGSMGIYMFKREVLIETLMDQTSDDFGHHVIPKAIDNFRVFGFSFNEYWEDIGTIRSYYDTTLALAQPDPPFNFHDPRYPVFTRARFLPGSRIDGATLTDVLLSDGTIINKAKISNSVIGLRSQIQDKARIKNTVIIGADFYQDPYEKEGQIPLGIGPSCRISGAIIDKNARFGKKVIIKPFPRGTDFDGDNFHVRDGIVVIAKGTTLEPGTYIGPEE